MRSRMIFNLAKIAALIAGAGLATTASAQFALGTGNALARDLQNGNPLAASSRDYAAEARARSAIVFGNAPGGFSFRGGLGYRDPGEFLGSLGSNDLHSFRRGTEISTLANRGIRPEQALESQSSLFQGSSRRSTNSGSLIVPRSGSSSTGSGAYAPSSRGSGSGTGGELRRDYRLEQLNLGSRAGNSLSSRPSGDGTSRRLNTLRSTASANSMLGNTRYGESELAQDSTRRLNGKTGTTTAEIFKQEVLEGMGEDRSLQGANRVRLSASRALQEQARRGGALGERPDTGGPDQSAQLGQPNPKMNLAAERGATAYDELRERIEKAGSVGAKIDRSLPGDEGSKDSGPGALDRSNIPDWQRRIDNLRQQITGEKAAGDMSISLLNDRVNRGADRMASDMSMPERKRSALIQPDPLLERIAGRNRGTKDDRAGDSNKPRTGNIPGELGTERAGDRNTDAPAPPGVDAATLDMIRSAATRVKDLMPVGGGGQDYYGEHMRAGQRLLAEGRFFDAEERFNRAVSLRPRDPSAMVGRVHSQLGAGVTLSAGQGLRRLLSAHPETTGQRYAENLLPGGKRTRYVVENLRDNLKDTGHDDIGDLSGLRRESALLLAYMGFQIGEIETAREGLDMMAKIAASDPAAKNSGDERLVELLRALWLDENLYKPEPSPFEDGKKPDAAPDAGEAPRK